MYSYLKQIQQLQKFIRKVAELGCKNGDTPIGRRCGLYAISPCLSCEALELVSNQEPVPVDNEGLNPPMSGMKL